MRSDKLLIPILSITGSDGTGGSGIQADIKTCGVLGGYALSVMTAITVQDTRGIQSTHPINADVISAQLESIIHDMPPKAVKIGMICSTEAIEGMMPMISQLSHIVLDTAFISSRGEFITGNDVIKCVCDRIMPISDIVIMKHHEAEMLIGKKINGTDEMVETAHSLLNSFGMKAIIIQGTHMTDNMSNDMFMTYAETGTPSFFTLPDHSNCNTHGLAGTLSASIATFLAKGLQLDEAVKQAYKYLQTLTVYSINSPLGHQSSLLSHSFTNSISPRQQEIYNALMQLISNKMTEQHDVSFYAGQLNITPRYLSQITMHITGKSPHQLIAEAIINEAIHLLNTTTKSIQEISFLLGFNDQAQFSKLFRKIKGIAPSKFRG